MAEKQGEKRNTDMVQGEVQASNIYNIYQPVTANVTGQQVVAKR